MPHPKEFLDAQEGDRPLISQYDKVQQSASSMIQSLWRRKTKKNEDKRDWVLLPVLIIPGIASSGLVIEHSGLSNERYAGQRVWMNAAMLATSRMTQGILNSEELKAKVLDKDADFQTIEQACQVRSAWLHHISLGSDMVHERTGNQVRPYKGLDGIEFLSDDAMTRIGSWVHAPVTKYLVEMGFTKGLNLDGAPYDWRLPPSVNEERDGYLSKTMAKIEEMYEANNELPVVLICHSMGCKMGHYLLNFCLQKKGQAWIDKYIHTYMPVGAPHCGVSLAVRAGVTEKGLNDQVDMLLEGDDEGLVLYRSWGSGAWLMPRYLPPHVLPSVICRREGELAVRIVDSVDVGQLFFHREKPPKELRLTVVYQGTTAHTDYVPLIQLPDDPTKKTLSFDETFYFAVPYKPDHENLGELKFFLEEPGGRLAQNQSEARANFTKYTSWAPIRSFKKKVSCLLRDVAKSIGTCLRVAMSVTPWELHVSQFIAAGSSSDDTPSEIESHIPLCCCQNKDGNTVRELKDEEIDRDASESNGIDGDDKDEPLLDQPLGALHVRVRYVPPPMPDLDAPAETPIACITPGQTPTVPIECSKKGPAECTQYDTWNGHNLLEHDGFCQPIWKLLKERYEGDPLGPTKLSAADPPPVKRIRSIYGINLQTEVCAVYRHRPVVIVGDDLADSRYIVDKYATFPSGAETWSGYKMVQGRIFETPSTLQRMPKEAFSGAKKKCCGDGTVPYWNLAHCLTWKDSVQDLTVDELDQAEHRGILADERFHALLKNYCKVRDPRTSALLHLNQQYRKENLKSDKPGAGGIGSLQAALSDSSL